MIVIAGWVEFAPEKVAPALEGARPLIEPVRAQAGCLDYAWTSDGIVPGRICIFERWTDEGSLAAHFAGPNYRGMLAHLAAFGMRGVEVRKYRVDLVEPVYDPSGKPRADFFTARSVGDVMQKDVKTIAPDKTLPDLERELLRGRIGALPVVERGGRLVGIVSRSDVVRQLCVERSLGEAMADVYRDQTDAGFTGASKAAIGSAIGQRMERLCVRDVMIREVLTVAPSVPVAAAARLLVERRLHRLPVVEGEKLVGIVSSLDLARVLAESGT